MEFLAVAEVSFCDAINNFSYRWKIEGAELSGIESFNGNSLRLPPESFMTGSSLVVTVMVVNSEIMEMARVSFGIKGMFINDVSFYEIYFFVSLDNFADENTFQGLSSTNHPSGIFSRSVPRNSYASFVVTPTCFSCGFS